MRSTLRSALRWLLRPRRVSQVTIVGWYRPSARVVGLALAWLALWAGPAGAQIGVVGEGQVSQPAGQDLSEPVRVATAFLTKWGSPQTFRRMDDMPSVTIQGRRYGYPEVRLIPPFAGLTVTREGDGARVKVASLSVEFNEPGGGKRRTAPGALTLIRQAGTWRVSAVEVQ